MRKKQEEELLLLRALFLVAGGEALDLLDDSWFRGKPSIPSIRPRLERVETTRRKAYIFNSVTGSAKSVIFAYCRFFTTGL